MSKTYEEFDIPKLPADSVISGMAAEARDVTAGTLRRLYIEMRSRIVTTPIKLKPTNQDIRMWTGLATACLDLGAKPIELMQAIFDYHQSRRRGKAEAFPYVSQLTAEMARQAWRDYNAARGITVDAATFTRPAEVEWSESLADAAAFLMRQCGSCNALDPAVIACLRLRISAIPAHVRCLVTDDEEVWRKFAVEAREYLCAHIPVAEAAAKAGFNVQKLMTYAP